MGLSTPFQREAERSEVPWLVTLAAQGRGPVKCVKRSTGNEGRQQKSHISETKKNQHPWRVSRLGTIGNGRG